MTSPKYAWVIGMCCFCIGIVTMGALTAFGYTMIGMAEDFGAQLSDLAIITSLYTLFSNGLAFVAGMIADKIGPRFTIGIGMLGNGVMILCAGVISQTLLVCVIFMCAAGAFASALIGSVMPKLISNWFAPNSRGKANMLYTMGPSISGAVFGIVLPIILMSGGWRMIFTTIAAINIILSIIFLLLCRDSPAKMGTIPFGYTEEEAAMLQEAADAKGTANTGAMLGTVLKYPLTWLFGISYALWMAYFATMNTYGTPSLMFIGIDTQIVGLMNSIAMVVVVFSQLFFSAMSDRFLSRKSWLSIVCFGHVALQIIWFFVLKGIYEAGGEANVPFILTFQVIMGWFTGQGALMNTINTEVFPPSMRAIGPACVATITLLGAVFGPLIAAQIIAANGQNPIYFAFFTAPALFIGTLLIQIFVPATGGKHGDPQAIKEARETLGDEAVLSRVSSTKEL